MNVLNWWAEVGKEEAAQIEVKSKSKKNLFGYIKNLL